MAVAGYSRVGGSSMYKRNLGVTVTGAYFTHVSNYGIYASTNVCVVKARSFSIQSLRSYCNSFFINNFKPTICLLIFVNFAA